MKVINKQIKVKPKYYFLSENDERCYTLQCQLSEAKEQGLAEIELFEAVTDKEYPEYVYCTFVEDIADKCSCNKSCPYFKRTDGRFCASRNKFYTPGKKVKFKVK
jgi:hypothetical protein